MSKQTPDLSPLALLDDYRQAINDSIKPFLDDVPAMLGFDIHTLPAIAADTLAKLEEFTLRPGKRIRGALAAAVYDSIKGTKLSQAGLKLAVTHELMQSYLLIVDDVADRSELRRGKPTIHELFRAEQDGHTDGHHANMLAMNVGLTAQHLANLSLTDIDERPDRIADTLRSLHTNLTMTGFGQTDDLHNNIERVVTEADIVRMYGLKTGYYTFVNPLATGTLLARSLNSQQLGIIEQFGRGLGAAFQMHDDYLGMFGETSETGKPNTDDLKEGKYTLLVQYALEHADVADVAKLRQLLGNPQTSDTDVHLAREIFDRAGATLYVREATQRYAEQAHQTLADIDVWNDEFRAFLTALITYATKRTS